MAQVTLQGKPCRINGELPEVGAVAPDFRLTDVDLVDVGLKDLGGKALLSVVPSLDTPVCATSAQVFNEAATQRSCAFVVVSADLPFAMSRFCTGAGLGKVRVLSMMRSRQFAEDYGVLITEGPLAGVAARAVIVIDGEGRVAYTELVGEIGDEPDYQAALKVLDALG